jgi:pilus assembly protein CpaB
MNRAVYGIIFVVSIVVVGVGYLQYRSAHSNVSVHQIIATTADMSTGTLLRAQDIVWQSVERTDPDNFIRPSELAIQAKPNIVEEMASSVHGAVLRRAVAAGQPIRRGDIVKPGDRDFLHVVLQPGTRAIAIPVATGGASTGLLSPGDRVDVILTQNFNNDKSQDMKNTPLTRRSVSETVVQNLRVLALNEPEIKKTGMSSAPVRPDPATGNFGRTVTLEVTPPQAELINVAAELGKLTVTLRNTSMVSAAPNGNEPTTVTTVKPMWAGDVSPALLGAAQPKPTAILPKQVIVLRGHVNKNDDHDVKRREIIKFDNEAGDKVVNE